MRKTLSGLTAVGLMLALAACGSSSNDIGVRANQGAGIGLSMPTTESDRWRVESDYMIGQFKDMGYHTDREYAQNKAADQSKQIQKMIDNGDKVLIISAVDGSSLGPVLANAAKKGVKVIAYDRLLTKTPNVDYQATFDNARVGTMQAQLLVDKLKLAKGAKGPFNVELFAGDTDDANAHSFFNASMVVLKNYIKNGQIVVQSGQTTFPPTAIPQYNEDKAAARMKLLLNQYYKGKTVDAVLSPYDGISRGIVTALEKDGYGKDGKKMPIIPGQDAEAASMALILSGLQTATIFKDTRELAKVAVQQANALLTGATVMQNNTVSNEVKDVPTYLLYPVQVDKSNYDTILIKSDYYHKTDVAAWLKGS